MCPGRWDSDINANGQHSLQPVLWWFNRTRYLRCHLSYPYFSTFTVFQTYHLAKECHHKSRVTARRTHWCMGDLRWLNALQDREGGAACHSGIPILRALCQVEKRQLRRGLGHQAQKDTQMEPRQSPEASNKDRQALKKEPTSSN